MSSRTPIILAQPFSWITHTRRVCMWTDDQAIWNESKVKYLRCGHKFVRTCAHLFNNSTANEIYSTYAMWGPSQIIPNSKEKTLSIYLAPLRFVFFFLFFFVSFFMFFGRFVCWRVSWKSTLSVAKISVYSWRWPRPSQCLLHFVVSQQVNCRVGIFVGAIRSHRPIPHSSFLKPIASLPFCPWHDISIRPSPELGPPAGALVIEIASGPGYGLAFEFILCRVLTFGNALNCNLYKH